eukprot:8582080-Lingulodinium_polyedra.AAC.1
MRRPPLWSTHGARVSRTCAGPQRRNAFPNACLSSSRARAAQKCAQICIWSRRSAHFAIHALHALATMRWPTHGARIAKRAARI